jgi:hypothetical protein
MRSSGARGRCSLIVVLAGLPRTTPCNPTARISRATVHRATSLPSRRNCCPTLRTPIDLEVVAEDPSDTPRSRAQFSRSSYFMRSRSPVVGPARSRRSHAPLSHPAAQLRSVSPCSRSSPYRLNRGAFPGVTQPPMLLNLRTDLNTQLKSLYDLLSCVTSGTRSTKLLFEP